MRQVTLRRYIEPLRPAGITYCRNLLIVLALFAVYTFLKKEAPQDLKILDKVQEGSIVKETSGEDGLKWLADISSGSDLVIDEVIAVNRQNLLQIIEDQRRHSNSNMLQLLRQRQIYKITDMDCLRHRKFTSERLKSSGIFSFFKNMVTPDDPYADVDLIFHVDNQVQWKSAGNRLTVYSNNQFSPFYIRLKLAQDQRISLFGLRIEEDKLAAMKTFSNYYLGTFDMSKIEQDATGNKYMVCRARNCNSHYTFLMFLFEKTQILELQVFGQNIS